MATLSNCDKAVAQSTVNLESGRAFLSNQLVALSKGKRLEQKMDVAASNFIKTVQALPLRSVEKESFFYELACLVRFNPIPLVTDVATLLSFVEYHRTKSNLLSEFHFELTTIGSDLDDIDFSYSFTKAIRSVYEKLEQKPVTTYEFNLLFRFSLSAKHSFKKTLFWLKYYMRFELDSWILMDVDFNLQQFDTLDYVLERNQSVKGNGLHLFIEIVKTVKVIYGHRFLFGKALVSFFRNAFPMIEQHLKGEFFETTNACRTKPFYLWLMHNRNFYRILLRDHTYIIEEGDLYDVDGLYDSEVYNAFLRLPFYKILKYLPNFLVGYFGVIPIETFLNLATGKNIRKISEDCVFTKKMAYVFHNLKFDEIRNHLAQNRINLYCSILALGGSEEIVDLLVPYFRFNLNYSETLEQLKPFVQKLIEWDILNNSTALEQNILLGYISHLIRDEPEFSIKGRTQTSFMRLAQAFYDENLVRQNLSGYSNLSWKGAKYDKWEDVINGDAFQIVQLTNSESLINESIQLNHCVRGYSHKCVQKRCSIWSLQIKHNRNSWKSLVTIEVNTANEIVQAKANFNSEPKAIYLNFIKAWAKQEKLTF